MEFDASCSSPGPVRDLTARPSNEQHPFQNLQCNGYPGRRIPSITAINSCVISRRPLAVRLAHISSQ